MAFNLLNRLLYISLIFRCALPSSNSGQTFKVAFLYSSLNSESWPEGFTAVYSAQIALQKIHESGMLPPGVDLELVYVATDCDPIRARELVMTLMLDEEIKLFIGPPCTEEAEDICGFLAHPFFRHTIYRKPFVISTAAQYFPMIVYQDTIVRRLLPDDDGGGNAFLTLFDWKRYGRIFDESFFEVIVRDDSDLDFGKREAMFYYNVNQSMASIKRGLLTFLEKDVKIILFSSKREIAKVVCAAETLGMFGPDYVWYARTWVWNNLVENLTEFCDEDQIENLKHADGFFAVEATPELSIWEDSDVFMTREMLYEQINGMIERDHGNNSTGFEPTFYDLYVYDAVWLVANSLKDIWNKTGQDLFDSFFESTKANSFNGLTGIISFDDGTNPLGSLFALRQFKGFEKTVTLAEGILDDLIFLNNVSWAGGFKPLDYTPKKLVKEFYKNKSIEFWTAVGLNTIAAVFIVVSCFCIVVNTLLRNKRMIKITSPVINNVILVGVILVVCTINFGSYLAFAHDPDVFLVICYCKTMLLAVGFTFGFCGIFCKTWRVYRALTGEKTNAQLQISDVNLLRKIGIPFLADIVYLCLKVFLDPYFVERLVIKTDVSWDAERTQETRVYHVALTCESEQQYFEVVLAGLKFLLIIFGVFLSIETRNVHIKELNDSKTIAVSIYNVVICFLVAAFVYYTSEAGQLTQTFLLQASIVLFCTGVLVGTHFLSYQIKVLKNLTDANEVNIKQSAASSNPKSRSKSTRQELQPRVD